jgi:hypothetical protein
MLAVAAGQEDGCNEEEGERRGKRIVRRDVRSVGRWWVGIREGGSVCRVCRMRKEVDICEQWKILTEREIQEGWTHECVWRE